MYAIRSYYDPKVDENYVAQRLRIGETHERIGLAERKTVLRGHESFVYDVAISPDGNFLASAAWDRNNFV